MKGGYLVCYAYSLDQVTPLRGEVKTFTTLLYREFLADGRAFLALHLAETNEPPTHRLTTHSTNLSERHRESDCIRFKSLHPLAGWVVFTELDTTPT